MGFWISMGLVFAVAITLRIYLPIRDRKLAVERTARWEAFKAKPEERKDKA